MQKTNVLVLSGVANKAKKEGFCYFKSDNAFIQPLYVRYNPGAGIIFDKLVVAAFAVGGIIGEDKRFERVQQFFAPEELLSTSLCSDSSAAPGANK